MSRSIEAAAKACLASPSKRPYKFARGGSLRDKESFSHEVGSGERKVDSRNIQKVRRRDVPDASGVDTFYTLPG